MKKFHHFSVLLLIFVMVFSVSMVYGCITPPGEPTVETETVMEFSPEEVEGEMSAEETETVPPTTAYTTGPWADISCILGYWEVEPDSLRRSANDVLGIYGSSLYITGLTGSVVYAFYPVSNERTPYRMDVWWSNLHITSMTNQQTLYIWADGVYTSHISSERERPGKIYCIPIPEEIQIEITDILLNGEYLTGGIDMSDLVNPDLGRTLFLECLGGDRISLQYDESGARPFYLHATTARTRVPAYD